MLSSEVWPIMKKAATPVFLALMSVGAASADVKPNEAKESYENCLIAGMVKFKDLCEPADQVAKAVVFQCNPQLVDLMRSLPYMKSFDKVELAREAPPRQNG